MLEKCTMHDFLAFCVFSNSLIIHDTAANWLVSFGHIMGCNIRGKPQTAIYGINKSEEDH